MAKKGTAGTSSAKNILPTATAFSPILPYDPGPLPTLPRPSAGETIRIAVDGYPPFKDTHQSIRNCTHRFHSAFKALRTAAVAEMRGRAWYFGDIRMDLTLFATSLPTARTLLDYLGGVMDTLGGSSGLTFTFLPIVYEDDCQVAVVNMRLVDAAIAHYILDIAFL